MVKGYEHPGDHLADHLVRVSLALDRALARRLGDQAKVDDFEGAILEHDALIAARLASSELELPLVKLADRFALSDAEIALLVAAALPGLDVGLAERWREQTGLGEPERRVFELVDLLAFDGGGATLVDLLGADRTLRQARLIEVTTGRDWAREAPLLQRVVSVPDRVVDALRGYFAFDPKLSMVATRMTHMHGHATPQIETLRDELAAATPLVVAGAALVGKATAIATAAAALGRDTIVVSLDVLAATGDGLRWIDDVRAQAKLLGDVLVLRAGDGIAELALPLQRAVIELINRGDAVITTRDANSVVRLLRAPRVIQLAVPDAVGQAAVWRAQLGKTDADVESIVARCSLPTGEIIEAAAAARSAATGRDIVTADLVTAARARLQHRLGDVASLVDTTLTWNDLVVREDVMERILEIISAVKHRSHVLNQWGLGSKLPYGRSVSALFSGPPGTGKTMVATLIAKELGFELFRVDLSKVVSKWLGETEKNLGKVFDESARVGAVLLFDEADALFAKRTEVRSSNDRNANLEVNYLLQRLEQHDGMVLLTTNALTSIDEAFKRRLRFRIDFNAPDAAEREALWRAMIPPQLPLAQDVDLSVIAARFKLAGGHIKNAVVRAAFLAAGRGARGIDQRTLLQAATLEWTELGNLSV